MDKQIKFKVTVTEKAMASFQLYHHYHKTSSLLATAVGGASLFIAVRHAFYGLYDQTVIFLIFAFMLLFFMPYTLWIKGKRQVRNSKVFQKPLEYTLFPKGISVHQDQSRDEIRWDQLLKAVNTKNAIYVYVKPNNAFIYPREDVADQWDDIITYIRKHMSPPKTKGLKG